MCEGLPDFDGKLVFGNFAGGGECHQLPAVPRFENQDGQLFLVGTVPADLAIATYAVPAGRRALSADSARMLVPGCRRLALWRFTLFATRTTHWAFAFAFDDDSVDNGGFEDCARSKGNQPCAKGLSHPPGFPIVS